MQKRYMGYLYIKTDQHLIEMMNRIKYMYYHMEHRRVKSISIFGDSIVFYIKNIRCLPTINESIQPKERYKKKVCFNIIDEEYVILKRLANENKLTMKQMAVHCLYAYYIALEHRFKVWCKQTEKNLYLNNKI